MRVVLAILALLLISTTAEAQQETIELAVASSSTCSVMNHCSSTSAAKAFS